jgi:hypothetical protein
MDKINIKVHPPWFARGTPVSNPRDGPAMALNDKLLFANPIAIGCRGPSARGEQGEVGSPESAVGSWQSADRRWNSDSDLEEEQSRGEPKGKTRLWLTLKTTFFNTQNSVYRQWYALLGRKCVNE